MRLLGFLLLFVSFLNAVDEIDVVALEGSAEEPHVDLEASIEEANVILDTKHQSSRRINGQVVIPTEPVTLTLFNTVRVFEPAPTSTLNKLKPKSQGNVNGQVVIPTEPVTVTLFNSVYVFGHAPTLAP